MECNKASLDIYVQSLLYLWQKSDQYQKQSLVQIQSKHKRQHCMVTGSFTPQEVFSTHTQTQTHAHIYNTNWVQMQLVLKYTMCSVIQITDGILMTSQNYRQ